MSEFRLTLISHAPTEALRRAAFPADEPVLESEISRMAGLRWEAPRAELIWSAPEMRTQQTARLLGLDANVSVALRDCDCGGWRGHAMDEIQVKDPEGLLAWLTD